MALVHPLTNLLASVISDLALVGSSRINDDHDKLIIINSLRINGRHGFVYSDAKEARRTTYIYTHTCLFTRARASWYLVFLSDVTSLSLPGALKLSMNSLNLIYELLKLTPLDDLGGRLLTAGPKTLHGLLQTA
jgi:hypothetical protein